MTAIAREVLLIALGLALIVPHWALWNACFSELFGFRVGFSRYSYGVLGAALMFLCLGAAAVGGAIIMWRAAPLADVACPVLLLGSDNRMGASLVFGFLVGILIPNVLYYPKRRQFLRWMEIASPHCEQCGYALRGLRVVMGRVRCPECGHTADARSIVEQYRHAKGVQEVSSGGEPKAGDK